MLSLMVAMALSIQSSWSQVQIIETRVNAATDDMEEYIPSTPGINTNTGGSRTVGFVDGASSDLELGVERTTARDPQLCGVRFTNLNIPKGAIITKAYIQFTVDVVDKNQSPCVLTIVGEAADNPSTFNSSAGANFALTSRPKTSSYAITTMKEWFAPADLNASGADQRTDDIRNVIQEIVNRNGWTPGNALALFLSGTGLREVHAFDGVPASAPLLHVEFTNAKSTFTSQVNGLTDDIEEYLPSITGVNTQAQIVGSVDPNSSDLELGTEQVNNGDPQLVAIRFNNITVPKGALVDNAYIQFTCDAINKNTSPCILTITGEAVDNAATFNTAPGANFTASARPKTTATVVMEMPNWTLVGAAGLAQRTANISSIINEIVTRSGWVSGNSLSIFISGTGLREAEAFESGAGIAPALFISHSIVTDVATSVVITATSNVISVSKGTLNLSASVFPIATASQVVEWSIIQTGSIAGINNLGVLNAIENGVVTVTAKAVGSSVVSNYVVSISGQDIATAITVTGASNSISTANGTLQLGYVVDPISASPSVNWLSNSPSIATVSGSGLVRALKNGVVTITGSVSGSVFSNYVITVSGQPISLISVALSAPNYLITNSGTALQFVATPTPADASTVTYQYAVSSSNVASISGSGLFIPKSNGVVTVSLTATGVGGIAIDTKVVTISGLVLPYVLFTSRINSALDDLEEFIPARAGQTNGRPVGSVDSGSSDVELGCESPGNTDPQLIGLRFTNINIPKGTKIARAYIQFTVDAIGKNTDPCNLVIRAETNDNPLTFNESLTFDLANRPKTADSVTTQMGPWTAIGQAGENQRTGDISKLIQQTIDRAGWVSGNPIALYITGTGTREADSYDGDAANAPLLVIEYGEPQTVNVRVNSNADDQEERLAGSQYAVGTLDIGSSDLELGTETANNLDPQMVGIRFTNIEIPSNAIITNAYIQFTCDATAKNTNPSNLVVKVEDSDNPLTFAENNINELTNRLKLPDSVKTSMGVWTLVGEAGINQRTTNLKSLVQKLVNLPGWVSGNAMAFYITGSGLREAESHDGDAPKAPLLVVEFVPTGQAGGIQKNITTKYPIKKNDSWSYWDKASVPGVNWTTAAFKEDTTWKFGNGPLGYGDLDILKVISFGPNTNNKFITSYFKKRFDVTLAGISDKVAINMMADDGAVVYLNGVEVAKVNLPSGTINGTTLATKNVEGLEEKVYLTFEIEKSKFIEGENVIAVEVHQVSSVTSDLRFDLQMFNSTDPTNPVGLGCGNDQNHISCFTSIIPSEKDQNVYLPETHGFQLLHKEGDVYSKGGGNTPGSFDFTGYVPENMKSSKKGVVSINHETFPGGLSMLDVRFDELQGKWLVDTSRAVSFANVVRTAANCSGGVTPWGTIMTCEETNTAGDENADGYQDLGWIVEVDAKTKKVKQYGNGVDEKLWAMGRISHENVVLKQDSLTAYYGEDEPNGNVFKFVANSKTNFSAGTLYVLKLNSGLVANEPTTTVGVWVQVPNTTKTERNTTKALAIGLGATPFNGVEDVEINPANSKIYFTAKGNNRTYRFKDNGSTVSEFETFVGGKSYKINYGGGLIYEEWGSGNDNLTFDDKGNLYVLQDGSRDHIWMVTNQHTQVAPKVELFMKTPSGSEPTGMTFTPDFKFMFMSIQSPSASNTNPQTDVKGTSVTFNKSTAIVVARKTAFDAITSTQEVNIGTEELFISPNPSDGNLNLNIKLNASGSVKYSVYDMSGALVLGQVSGFYAAGTHQLPIKIKTSGLYLVHIESNGKTFVRKAIVNP